MCGIAGFCVSDQVTDRWDKNKFIDSVQLMLDLNLHRGGDAAGYMAQFSTPFGDGYQSLWWKAPGEGKEISKQVERDWSNNGIERVPNVFGLHTRAKSAGFSELDNDNNHPVIYGSVAAIHNGKISNHTQIKSAVNVNSKNPIPHTRVDSIAIPALLNRVEHPEKNFDELAELLPQFEGGFAFHAIWMSHPGYSLLVAGPRYPLVLWRKKDVVAYSSESGCVRDFTAQLDEKFPNKTEPRKLDPGTFVLVKDGELVKYGTYDLERKEWRKLHPTSSVNTNAYSRWSNKWKQWINKSGHRTGVTTVTENRWYSSVDYVATDGKHPVLLWTKDKGMSDRETVKDVFTGTASFPTWNVGDTPIVMAEWRQTFEHLVDADRVYVMREPAAYTGSWVAYGWFGTTEVAVSEHGSLVGVYDWSGGLETPVYKTTYDLQQEAKAKPVEDVAYSPVMVDSAPWGEWLRLNSRAANEPLLGEKIVGSDDDTSGWLDYRYKEGDKGKDCKIPGPISGTNSGINTYHLDAVAEDWMSPMKTLFEVESQVEEHMNPLYKIPLLWNEECGYHDNQEFKTHTNPFDCANLLTAVMCTVSFFDSLEIWEKYFDDEMVLTTTIVNVDPGCKHRFVTTVWDVYPIGSVDISIPYKDECEMCGATREISEYPRIVREFMISYAEKYDDDRKGATK